MNKWGKDYWIDLGERVGSTLVYGLITLLAANNITDLDPETAWAIVGLPTVLSALKGLAVNLKDDVPTASIVGVTSDRDGVQQGAVDDDEDDGDDGPWIDPRDVDPANGH